MKNFAIGFFDEPSVIEQVRLAKYAELRGLDSVWVTETRMVRDAVSVLGAMAANTQKIRLGSAVINVWSRIAPLTALTWNTLNELAPGRMILGLGAWWDPLAFQCGVSRRMIMTRMREYVHAVRALLDMRSVSIDGATLQIRNLKLDRPSGTDDSPRKVPIFIGATGFQLLELAGEIADGIILDSFVSPSYNRKAIEYTSKGVTRSGKSLKDIEIAQMIFCSVDDDADVAMNRARDIVTLYLSLRDARKPWIPQASGVPLQLVDDIRKTIEKNPGAKGLATAREMVDEKIVSLLTASGTVTDCKSKVKKYVDSGCTLPILCIGGSRDPRHIIDQFSETHTGAE